MADRGLTLTEAMTVLGIGKTKIYELINNGELKTFDVSDGKPKTPRRVGEKGPRPSRRIQESELKRYINQNRVPAGSAPSPEPVTLAERQRERAKYAKRNRVPAP